MSILSWLRARISFNRARDPERDASQPDEYDAFFSYTTGADGRMVRSTERYLEGFHRQALLRRLKLKPLRICVDGSDIRPRSGDTLESVDATLRRYLDASHRLVVFCSPAVARSSYVNGEIVAFLEKHSDGAVMPVVVSGDPSRLHESFPAELIARRYHEAIWIDLRGARLWWWRRRALRVRAFREERVRLATWLHDQSPAILPAWRRAEKIRRRLSSAAMLLAVAVTWTAIAQVNRNNAHQLADDVRKAIQIGGPSIATVRAQAFEAVSKLHDENTDGAYREADALALLRLTTNSPFVSGQYAMGAKTGTLARVSSGGLEVTDDVSGGAWRLLAAGNFKSVSISDDGGTIAAADDKGLQIWRGGTAVRCAGWPMNAVAVAVAIDPTGERVAAVAELPDAALFAIGDANECGGRNMVVTPWPVEASRSDGLLQAAPSYARARLQLSSHGSAVIASSRNGWLLGTLIPADKPMVVLNQRLITEWRSHFPPESAGGSRPLAIMDATFNADGSHALVAAEIEGLASRLAPPALFVPLAAPEPVSALTDSRGARRVTIAASGAVAWAVEKEVRISTSLLNAPAARFRAGANIAALTFSANDRVLVVADGALPPRLYAIDAATGTVLSPAVPVDRAVLSLHTSARKPAVVIAQSEVESVMAAFEVDPSELRSRLHKHEELLSTGALLSDGGVAVTGNSRMLNIRAGGAATNSHAIQLPMHGLQLAASKDAIYVLGKNDTDATIARCHLATSSCESPRNVGSATGIAADDSGKLRIACTTGEIVGEEQPCPPAPAVPIRSPQSFAAGAQKILRFQDDSVCIAPESDPRSCTPLPITDPPLVGAVSSRGDIAVLVRVQDSSRADVYRKVVMQWFPWPTRNYVRVSTIPLAGDAIAAAFSADGSELRAAATWGADVVVSCFPITTEAIGHAAERRDDPARCQHD